MSLWALRAAGVAALALGYQAWRWWSTKSRSQDDDSVLEAVRDREQDSTCDARHRVLAACSGDNGDQEPESPVSYANAVSDLESEHEAGDGQDALARPAAELDGDSNSRGLDVDLRATPSGLQLGRSTNSSDAVSSKAEAAQAPLHGTAPPHFQEEQPVASLSQKTSASSGKPNELAPRSPFAEGLAESVESSSDELPESPLANGRRTSSGLLGDPPSHLNGRTSSGSCQLSNHQEADSNGQPFLDSWGARFSADSEDTGTAEGRGSSSDSEDQPASAFRHSSNEAGTAGPVAAVERLPSFPTIDYEPDPPSNPRPGVQMLSSLPPTAALGAHVTPANTMAQYIQDQHWQTLPTQRLMHDGASPSLLEQRGNVPTHSDPSPLGKPPFTPGATRLHRLERGSAPPNSRRWSSGRRSIDLQPAPTEDVNGLLDQAVRELVSERAQPGLLGSRSLSDSNLSKRSSGDRADSVSHANSGDHRASLPVDVEADELRDRLSDVDRTNSDASAAETAGVVTDASAGSTSRFGMEAATRHGGSSMSAAASLKRTRESEESVPLSLRLDALAGSSVETLYQSEWGTSEVNIGRLEENTLTVLDSEVSGHHISLRWDGPSRAWQVLDLGSLNGTMLNDRIISTSNRRPGRALRLSSDDILQLGSRIKLKVTCMPHEMSQVTLPRLAPKRLSTQPRQHRPLHSSTTMRSDAVSRLALQAELPQDCQLAIPSLGISASAVVRPGRGRRHKSCEDVVLCQRTVPGAPCDAALFCVFDGHNGRGAADEVKVMLPQMLSERLSGLSDRLESAAGLGDVWGAMYSKIDAAIQSEDGCTATTLLAWQDCSGRCCIQVANVGDSSAIFVPLDDQGAPSAPARYLTADHRLTNAAERDRLQGLGITLGHGGTRLYGLNLGRCLGDRYLKVEDLGLSAQPHVSPVERLPDLTSSLVIIASDGVWDVASPDRVVQAAMEARDAQDGNVEGMARAVAAHAQRQHTKDDVSIIVLRFNASFRSSLLTNGLQQA